MSKENELKQQIWEQSKEWIDGIGRVVNEMASKLGIATQHVYEVYTKQMFAEGVIAFTIGFIALIFLTIFVIKVLIPLYDGRRKYSDEFDLFLITIAAIAVLFCSVFFGIHDGFLKIMNPEYYTMKDLLETVQKMAGE